MTRPELEAKMNEIHAKIKELLKGHGEIVWAVVAADVTSDDIVTVHPSEVNALELFKDASYLLENVTPDQSNERPVRSKRSLN